MKYLGLLIAVVLAVVAAFAVLRFSGSEPPPPQPTQPVQITQPAPQQVETVNIYIAARDIPIGTRIDANMVTTQPWPRNLVVDGFIVGAQEAQNAIGTVARSTFKRNEPLNKNKLVNPDDPNFLAGDLPAGKRAVTISTDEIAGVAGFIFPGDRVDVLVTHDIIREGITEQDMKDARSERDLMEQVTETLLYDVPILAVDQRATAGVDEDKGIIIPRSVSLEVVPQDAQKLRLAGEIGELSLALRSLEDKDAIETVAITRPSDLSQFKSPAAAPATFAQASSPAGPVRVIRGTEVEVLEEPEPR